MKWTASSQHRIGLNKHIPVSNKTKPPVPPKRRPSSVYVESVRLLVNDVTWQSKRSSECSISMTTDMNWAKVQFWMRMPHGEKLDPRMTVSRVKVQLSQVKLSVVASSFFFSLPVVASSFFFSLPKIFATFCIKKLKVIVLHCVWSVRHTM